MSAVLLNNKFGHNIKGDFSGFKPKYLYYDLPEELQQNLEDNIPSTSQRSEQQNEYTEKIDII